MHVSKGQILLGVALLIILVVTFTLNQFFSGRLESHSFPSIQKDISQYAGIPPASDLAIASKRTRTDASEAKELQRLERSLDKLLPATMDHSQSSLCEVELKPDETLIIGGFETADGSRRFTFISPTRSKLPGESDQFTVSSQVIGMDPELATELGLDSLMTRGFMRRQRTVVTGKDTTEANLASLTGTHRADHLSNPVITTHSDTPFSITVSDENLTYTISGMASSAPGNDNIIFRARIETSGFP